MNKNNLPPAEKALQRIAKGEGKTVAEIRGDIQRALLVGLNSEDPDVRARWRAIPSKGDMPTPEEVIAHLADGAGKKRNTQ